MTSTSIIKRSILRTLGLVCVGFIMRHMALQQPGQVLWAFFLLYALIPLVSLSLTTRQEAYVLAASLIIGGGLIRWRGISDTDYMASAICLVGFTLSVLYHRYLLATRSYVRPWTFSSVHSALFCMTCAVAGSLSLMSNSEQRTATCDTLHRNINKHLGAMMIPLRFSQEQSSVIQSGVDTFFTKSSTEVVQEGLAKILPSYDIQPIDTEYNYNQEISGGNIQELLNNLSPEALSGLNIGSGDMYSAQQKIAQILASWQQQPTHSQTTTLPPTDQSLEGILAQYKSQLLDLTLTNKQDLDDKLCNVVFDQIKQRSLKPWFRFSIFLTLVLFFYPLLKFFTYIYSRILSGVYRLLRKAGFIRTVTQMEPTQRWEV